jgi:hypothetical protein
MRRLFDGPGRTAAHAPARRSRPLLETLEDRLAPVIIHPGWVEAGPGPITMIGNFQGDANAAVAGAINAIAVHPTNPNLLLVGTVNGGIWRTTNASSAANWLPVTDDLPRWPSATSPSAGRRQHRPRRHRQYSSNEVIGGGPGVGVYKSSDGGVNWAHLGERLHRAEDPQRGADHPRRRAGRARGRRCHG